MFISQSESSSAAPVRSPQRLAMKNFRPRQILLWLVTLVTLGSGVVNLYSVIGPNLPERQIILEGIFPLEFLHLSRFLTVLIGFALVISSINIYKRKQRAWWSVMLLASASIIFHFTKGLDYEEAALSLVLLVLLILARKIFTVKSSVPDWRWGLLRLGITALIAFGYGVAGFWFLEPREFGMNFHWQAALRHTLEFLSLQGNPQLVPHTRYARWFLDSLYLITLTAVGYALFALFRPALYRLRTVPQDHARAAAMVSQHGRTALDYFKYWPDKTIFFSSTQNSFLAYRVGANVAMVLGDPIGAATELEKTIREFMAFCKEHDWRVAFHQAAPENLPLYNKIGLKKLKIGDDAVVDLATFDIKSSALKRIRTKINQLDRAGFQTIYYAPPIPAEIMAQLKDVSDEWLRIPGRRERRFTLGRFESKYVRATPVIAATDKDGRIEAFLNLIPSHFPGEATVDLMRHRENAPTGIMDYLFVKTFQQCKAQAFTRFNLGMAPMAGFQEHEEAAPEERAVHYFFQHLNFIFSYRGLRQYKAKFATIWEPRYLIYENILQLPKLALALNQVSEIKD